MLTPVGRGRSLCAFLLRGQLTSYAVREADDGYRVVFALAELDSGSLESEVLVADTLDGAPLGAKLGSFQLVAPHEKHRSDGFAC